MIVIVIMNRFSECKLESDTTCLLIKEFLRRNHTVFQVLGENIECLNSTVLFNASRITWDNSKNEFMSHPQGMISGHEIDVVLLRTDPPFDVEYLWITNILELLPKNVFVMNNPRGVRSLNEKLSALFFPSITPKTFISQNICEIETFRVRMGGDVVVKPLDGFGGSGVFLVRENDPNRKNLIRTCTNAGRRKVVVQEVIKGHNEGDKRVILLNGEPIGCILRKNLASGFVHNLAMGGTAIPAKLTSSDREICKMIRQKLVDEGQFLVGIDIIGDRLVEINVTSPTGLVEINKTQNAALEQLVISFIESKIS